MHRFLVLVGAWLVAGCRPSEESRPIRLVDVFADEMVEGRPATPPEPPPRTEWTFAETTGTAGFDAFADVSGLAVREGRLAGRATSDFPLLHVERTEGLDNRDQLHSIEVRMRASAGANFTIVPSVEPVPGPGPARFLVTALGITTPIVAGNDVQTYTLRSGLPLSAQRIRHLYIRPTDAADADFAIESIRLVFRKEYLAGIESGVGFQGMSEIYRESLVSRAPETIRVPVEVPPGSRLQLSLGTVDPMPVTFRVAMGEDVLLEETVTTPYRWEERIIDLSTHVGRSGRLSLSLSSEEVGNVGIWGTPVIRPPAAPPEDRPRNVVLLWTDTLRNDHLSPYGYERDTSPNLKRLASEGVLFLNNVSQATWTKVSTPSLMTSLYPSTHGVKEFSDYLPASATTLAEVYRGAGYATVSFASNLFTGQFTNLHQGFEELHEDGSLPEQGSSKTSREYIDRFTRWLEVNKDIPFFAFLHLYDPHDPFEPRPPYASLWADPEKKHKHEEELAAVRKVITEPLAQNFGMPSRTELEQAGIDADQYVSYDKDWYDGSIRGMDAEVGRLLERLRMLGLEESTLVVFVGDHGEEFLDHGRTFHGQSVYGELTRVPLMMRWPAGLPAGRVIDAVTETIDIMPTLLALSGLDLPETIQGHSLVPLFRSEDRSWQARPAFSEKAPTKPQAGSPWPAETEAYSIVQGEWKLIHNIVPEEGKPEFELFRFADDPLDQNNVAAENDDVVRRLSETLEGWRQMANAAKLSPDSEHIEGMSQQQLERLRSLGYIR
ncbi:MAG TPA: sulfatase [Vicinamibacteria bacterium]|nr:sulfatase [Vicinamibacteria bacterium]